MQIVVPMSGFGERFRRVGYRIPKPLIEIADKPVIAHVIDMFPGEHDFLFICNQGHLTNSDYGMEKILQQYCPSGNIVAISPHKLGPVHAVLQVESLIDTNRQAKLSAKRCSQGALGSMYSVSTQRAPDTSESPLR